MTQEALPPVDHETATAEDASAPPRPATPALPSRAERWAPLITGLALALPTLLAHNLPMSDLPMHESVVGILRHWGDTEYFPDGLYRLNFGHPNQLFHLASALLSFAVGTTWGCKLVIAITQVLILVTGARLADYMGRSRWAALLLAPLALGFTFYWGLVANLLGFATFFAALPLIDRAAKEPNSRSLAKVLGMFVLLFLAHESVFVTAIGFAGLLAIAYPLERRLTPLRLVPVVFGVAVVGGHLVYQARFFPPNKVEHATFYAPLWDKLRQLPADLFGSHDVEARGMLFGLAATAVVALLVARVRSREPLPARTGGIVSRIQSLLFHYRFEATAAVFVVAYAAAPLVWNTATLIHARFLGPAWALIALTAGPKGDSPRITKLCAVVVPLGILLLAWPQFVDSHTSYTNLDRIIARIPKGSSVAMAAIDKPQARTRVYSASVGAARTVADRGGRFSLSLTPSPISPVQILPEYRWNELDRRLLLSSSTSIMPSFDLDRFGWVIAQSRDPATRSLIVIAFKPDAELVAIEGEWILLRSTHPQAPLKSPDTPPPPPEKASAATNAPPRTIMERTLQVAAIRDEIVKGRLTMDALDPPPWMRENPPMRFGPPVRTLPGQ